MPSFKGIYIRINFELLVFSENLFSKNKLVIIAAETSLESSKDSINSELIKLGFPGLRLDYE